jgi:carbamoyltransferase
MTAVLGVSAFYHDSAAALVVDGKIVAAAQEERFTRKKNDPDFPVNAIEYCLKKGGLTPEQLDYVGFYDKPFLKFERLLETYLAFVPQGFGSFMAAMPQWLRTKLYLPREMSKGLNHAYKKRYVFTEHHESHAASAFFPSPFEEAAILTLDGVGEWATASFGTGRGNKIQLTHEMRFPHSLGLLYSAFTYYTGFTVNSGEYKLMGLAPYGEPTYVKTIMDHLIDLKEDGSFRMDMSYFNYCQGLTMTSKKFEDLFGGPPRRPDSLLTQKDMDLAASVQKVTEEAMLRSARHVHKLTGMKNLCLAGGVALNCVGNGKVLREGPFENLWIQPAAGDAGGALGTALFIWHQLLEKPRTVRPRDQQQGSLLGPEYDDEQIRQFLDSESAHYEYVKDDDELCAKAAAAIAQGQVLGWMQGRTEFGPRALGSRSIIGDPRRPEMQTIINVKVKFREGFRPFAPAVLEEHCSEYFGLKPGEQSPYMLLVAPVQQSKRVAHTGAPAKGIAKLKEPRSVVQSITHVDYSARVQTVDAERHGLYRKLIEKFYEKTGCPVIVNTSFNLSWEPIVNTPREAFCTFMGCDLDMLVMGHFVLRKEDQPAMAGPDNSRADGARPDGAKPSMRVAEALLRCPCHGDPLEFCGDTAKCVISGHRFVQIDGIWQMFWPHEQDGVGATNGKMAKAIDEKTPVGPQGGHDTLRSLMDKARKDVYAHSIDESIGYNSTVLEIGCGTGEISNLLGIGCRRVVGTSVCTDSLRRAEQFRQAQGLDRVQFVRMNPSWPCFDAEQFDVLLCNDALDHMADPKSAFMRLVPLLKPGGHLVLGLHSACGRLKTGLRREALRSQSGGAIGSASGNGSAKSHKREKSAHSIDELLGWFEEAGLEFLRAVPSLTPGSKHAAAKELLTAEPVGNALDHLIVQLQQLAGVSRNGGIFIMSGRKPAAPARMKMPRQLVEVRQ